MVTSHAVGVFGQQVRPGRDGPPSVRSRGVHRTRVRGSTRDWGWTRSSETRRDFGGTRSGGTTTRGSPRPWTERGMGTLVREKTLSLSRLGRRPNRARTLGADTLDPARPWTLTCNRRTTGQIRPTTGLRAVQGQGAGPDSWFHSPVLLGAGTVRGRRREPHPGV